MHFGALDDLVDRFLLFTQSQADNVHILRVVPQYRLAVSGVVAGREHLFDIDGELRVPIQGAGVYLAQTWPVGGQDHDRLDQQRVVGIARGILVNLAQQLGPGAQQPGGQKGRYVQLLPNGKIVADDNGDLCIKFKAYSAGSAAAARFSARIPRPRSR